MNNEEIIKKTKEYLNYYENVDWQPFIVSTSDLKDLIYFQDIKYVQNKFNIVELVFLVKLLYNHLLNFKGKEKKHYNFIDPSEIVSRYNLKSLLKYNKENTKFITYYNQWIRKIKFEYAKKIKIESKNEIYMDFSFF